MAQPHDPNNPNSVENDLDDGLGDVVPIEGQVLTQDEADLTFRGQSMALVPQRVLLPEGASKGDAIHLLSKDIPKNEYGLPTFFYRSDLLPFDLATLTTEDADNAAVPLDYSDGYPTFNGGHIFWQQFPHEPYQSFLLFQRYLDQAEELGLRQLQLLAMDQKHNLGFISELAKEYCWGSRARSYDLFQIAADKKKRELRARRTEGAHYDIASNLLETLMTKFNDADWINQLTPKEALDALGDLIKIQRVALGLTANGNAGPSSNNPTSAASAEFIMREITKAVTTGDDSVSLTDDLQDLMKDPSFTMKAQELIFRINGAGASQDTSNIPGVN